MSAGIAQIMRVLALCLTCSSGRHPSPLNCGCEQSLTMNVELVLSSDSVLCRPFGFSFPSNRTLPGMLTAASPGLVAMTSWLWNGVAAPASRSSWLTENRSASNLSSLNLCAFRAVLCFGSASDFRLSSSVLVEIRGAASFFAHPTTTASAG